MSADAQLPDQWPARAFGDVLAALTRSRRWKQRGKFEGLRRGWQETAGEGVAAQTDIRSYAGGELVIEVRSSALMHELNNFLKPALLAALRKMPEGRDVAKLRFTLGAARSTPDQ